MSRLPYIIEPMTLADVDEVVEIERASFPFPWPRRAFLTELALPYGVYRVVRLPVEEASQERGGESQRQPWWSGALATVLRGSMPRRPGEARGRCGPIVGYVGFQVILDEGHVMTLAVHPDYRRQGIGELLLQYLYGEARRRGALRLTLEVRVSNLAAIALYRKYGFAVQGRRRRYYANGEDALIMWTSRLDAPEELARLEELRTRLLQRMEKTRDPDLGSGDFV